RRAFAVGRDQPGGRRAPSGGIPAGLAGRGATARIGRPGPIRFQRVLAGVERGEHAPRVHRLGVGHAQAHPADGQAPGPVHDRAAAVVEPRRDAFGLQPAERKLGLHRVGEGGEGGEHGRGLRYAAAMRRAILTMALSGLAACGGQAPSAGAGPGLAGTGPEVERVVEDWPLPATLPGSALPDLANVQGRTLLLAWTHSQPGRRHALQLSSYDVAAARWQRRPTTIAVGNSMFVNWADTPHIMATADGALWAHWLQKRGDGPYAYDIMLATSRDGGRWSAPVSPHGDGTATEHGFVSMWPRADGGLGVAWLDGRATAGRAPSHGEGDAAGQCGGGGPMAPRGTAVGATLRLAPEVEVDASVCDCCQTAAAGTARGPLLVYRARREGEVRDIHATRLGDGGWSAPAPVHADGW